MSRRRRGRGPAGTHKSGWKAGMTVVSPIAMKTMPMASEETRQKPRTHGACSSCSGSGGADSSTGRCRAGGGATIPSSSKSPARIGAANRDTEGVLSSETHEAARCARFRLQPDSAGRGYPDGTCRQSENFRQLFSPGSLCASPARRVDVRAVERVEERGEARRLVDLDVQQRARRGVAQLELDRGEEEPACSRERPHGR